MIYNLISYNRRKTREDVTDESSVRIIFSKRESLMRYYLFLVFVLCEFGYFFDYNIYGIFEMFRKYNETSPIDIGWNCSLDATSFLGRAYSTDPANIFLAFLRTHSTTLVMMMVWFYAVSLLHLTHVARGYLKSKVIKRLVLIGVIMGMFVFTLRIIPWTSLLAVILQSMIGQINVILAWRMSRKFQFAMRSRVNEAFHTGNKSMNEEQEKLYRTYKVLIPVILIALQLYYTSSNVFFNTYLLLETFTFNSCWFRVMFNVNFNFDNNKILSEYIGSVNFGLLIVARFINIAAYSMLLTVNIWLFMKSIKNSSQKVKYRYRIFSSMSVEKQNFL